MLVSRLFAVLAATAFVAAFSLMVLAPPGQDLLHGLAFMEPGLLQRLPRLGVHLLGRQVWSHVAVPVLIRPVWMVPLTVALLSCGLSVTLAPASAAPRHPGLSG